MPVLTVGLAKGRQTADFDDNAPAVFDFMEEAARAALEVTDGYVWVYTERPRWWTNEMLPKEHVDALAGARKGEK